MVLMTKRNLSLYMTVIADIAHLMESPLRTSCLIGRRRCKEQHKKPGQERRLRAAGFITPRQSVRIKDMKATVPNFYHIHYAPYATIQGSLNTDSWANTHIKASCSKCMNEYASERFLSLYAI